MNHPEYVIKCLNNMIRYNKKIQTVNLNNCGLNGQVLVGLVQSLRHAKSLLCLHLASNPGISKKVENFYRERLSIVPYQDDINIDIEVEDLESMTNSQIQAMTKD